MTQKFLYLEGPTGSCSVSSPACPLILHLEENRRWTRKGLTFWRERSIKNWADELSFRWTWFHSSKGVTTVGGTPQTPMPSLRKEWDTRVRAHPTCPSPTQAPVLLRGCCCRAKCVQSGTHRRSSRSYLNEWSPRSKTWASSILIVSYNSEEDTLSVPQVNKVKAEFHYHYACYSIIIWNVSEK